MDKKIYSSEYFKLWVLLRRVHDILMNSREKEVETSGLTVTKIAILELIDKNDGSITPRELAERLLRKTNSVSEILNRMQNDGLIKKTGFSGRGKRIIVTWTKKGKNIVRNMDWKSIHDPISSLSEEERKELEVCLRKLWRSVNQGPEETLQSSL